MSHPRRTSRLYTLWCRAMALHPLYLIDPCDWNEKVKISVAESIFPAGHRNFAKLFFSLCKWAHLFYTGKKHPSAVWFIETFISLMYFTIYIITWPYIKHLFRSETNTRAELSILFEVGPRHIRMGMGKHSMTNERRVRSVTVSKLSTSMNTLKIECKIKLNHFTNRPSRNFTVELWKLTQWCIGKLLI